MKSFKALVLAGLAGSALLAGQAMATPCPANTQGDPVCIATHGGDGAGTSLQELLDSHLTNGPGIDVYNDQADPSSYWQIGGTGYSVNVLELEISANSNINSFGIFDPNDPSNYLELFSGSNGAGDATFLQYMGGNTFGKVGGQSMTFSGSTFGYYLNTAGSTFFYSDPNLNGGDAQMVAFNGDGQSRYNFNGNDGVLLNNEYILAWEDAQLGRSDRDYNDFVVMVESVRPVPEPAALGMFGFGVLLIGAAVVWNRRRNQVKA